MPKNIPSLKPRELIRILERGGCAFYREGKGDHCLYSREVENHRVLCQLTWEREKCLQLTSCVFLDNLVLLMKK
jgi:predicted RNA binding protein YcfA (HicA-like mRNA interferase family)